MTLYASTHFFVDYGVEVLGFIMFTDRTYSSRIRPNMGFETHEEHRKHFVETCVVSVSRLTAGHDQAATLFVTKCIALPGLSLRV